MKTFKDLDFKPHSIRLSGEQATMNFDNKYGVSVISGPMFYTNISHPYEVAILYNDSITYNTSIANDALGYQTKAMVTNIMKKVQLLKD